MFEQVEDESSELIDEELPKSMSESSGNISQKINCIQVFIGLAVTMTTMSIFNM